jgi:hypothetical protein
MNRALAARLKSNGIPITPEQWAVLAAVMDGPGSAQARIAEKGLKDRATVTQISGLNKEMTRGLSKGEIGDLLRLMNKVEGNLSAPGT